MQEMITTENLTEKWRTLLSIPFGEHTLHAEIRHCQPGSDPAGGCIFYLHGGGLVFGTMDDLPPLYENMFLDHGYDLICLDYPLAPESSLTEILKAVHNSVLYILTHPQAAGYKKMPEYTLFGRSAGAYLALMEAKRLCRENPAETAAGAGNPAAAQGKRNGSLPRPKQLLCFYGYHSFDLPEFSRPAPAYTRMPAVSKETVEALTGRGFITDGPMEKRYGIYIYARQNGCWPSFLGSPNEVSAHMLTDTDCVLLPPGFFSASSGDQDVPFRESKQLARKIPGSKFMPVYFLEHDFDRNINRPEGPEVYRAAIAWMKSRESS